MIKFLPEFVFKKCNLFDFKMIILAGQWDPENWGIERRSLNNWELYAVIKQVFLIL